MTTYEQARAEQQEQAQERVKATAAALKAEYLEKKRAAKAQMKGLVEQQTYFKTLTRRARRPKRMTASQGVAWGVNLPQAQRSEAHLARLITLLQRDTLCLYRDPRPVEVPPASPPDVPNTLREIIETAEVVLEQRT